MSNEQRLETDRASSEQASPTPRFSKDEKSPRAGRPLALGKRLTIAELHFRGYSEAQIAKALGIQPADCRASLADARQVLEASAVALAGDALTASHIAARRGDHRPALELLDRLHVTEPVVTESTTVGVSVQISGFTLPGLPVQMVHAGQLPPLDITAQEAKERPALAGSPTAHGRTDEL